MRPPSTTPPKLPLATNRAALSNQISLLLSRRTALLGSLTAGSRSPAAAGAESSATRRVVVPDEDLKPTRPNDGVGYAPGPSAVDGSKTRDDVLRGRILGKRKGGAVSCVPVGAESESDDDEGRAAVGRPKRARVSRDGDVGSGESTSEKKKKKKKKG